MEKKNVTGNDRELPKKVIGGITFLVDVAYGEIREQHVPQNTILFNQMRDTGKNYEFDYSPYWRNVAYTWTRPYFKIELDYMVKLDPERMAKKYGLAIDQLPQRDSQLVCDPGLIKDRLAGNLPRIKIHGERYIVDLEQKELRPEKAKGKPLI
ncbi:hypothetical protein [Olivibacter jilunii]|uniref:hypothetical protein n=1 Tax=Olivibacter jilunii TaxID=985016 RepID=UPI0010301046|nr:hypothetical protein [Olivibacter jilunii]